MLGPIGTSPIPDTTNKSNGSALSNTKEPIPSQSDDTSNINKQRKLSSVSPNTKKPEDKEDSVMNNSIKKGNIMVEL